MAPPLALPPGRLALGEWCVALGFVEGDPGLDAVEDEVVAADAGGGDVGAGEDLEGDGACPAQFALDDQ